MTIESSNEHLRAAMLTLLEIILDEAEENTPEWLVATFLVLDNQVAADYPDDQAHQEAVLRAWVNSLPTEHKLRFVEGWRETGRPYKVDR